MVKNPPENCQRIVPYLSYADASAAIEFICKAFGFAKGLVLPMQDGKIGHAEVHRAGETLMLASEHAPANMASPRNTGQLTAAVVVYVDDLEAHYQRAKAAGAQILAEPADQFYGDRAYTASDPEGHRWSFHQHVKDVDVEALLAGIEEREEGSAPATA